MPGIKQPIQDILAKLSTLQFLNQDNQTVALFARIFNDQYKKLDKGEIQTFPLPAGFLQVLNPLNLKRIGAGFDAADVIFRIHLGHWFTDAMDGTFEQDLPIFDLRDQVVALLSDFQPSGCGLLMHTADNQNYEHTNVYVYELDFNCHFIDSKGSPYDPASTVYKDSIPPTGIEIDVTKTASLSGQIPGMQGEFRIPQNKSQ